VLCILQLLLLPLLAATPKDDLILDVFLLLLLLLSGKIYGTEEDIAEEEVEEITDGVWDIVEGYAHYYNVLLLIVELSMM